MSRFLPAVAALCCALTLTACGSDPRYTEYEERVVAAGAELQVDSGDAEDVAGIVCDHGAGDMTMAVRLLANMADSSEEEQLFLADRAYFIDAYCSDDVRDLFDAATQREADFVVPHEG